MSSFPIIIVTSTLLDLDSLDVIVPVSIASFIFFNVVSCTFFLFIIVVFEVVFVFPVLVTLKPAFCNLFTTVCNFLLSPLPFNTSSFSSELFLLEFIVLSEVVSSSVVLSSLFYISLS